MCFDAWPVWGMLGVDGVVVVEGGREEMLETRQNTSQASVVLLIRSLFNTSH